jgi:hypothetical protein
VPFLSVCSAVADHESSLTRTHAHVLRRCAAHSHYLCALRRYTCVVRRRLRGAAALNSGDSPQSILQHRRFSPCAQSRLRSARLCAKADHRLATQGVLPVCTVTLGALAGLRGPTARQCACIVHSFKLHVCCACCVSRICQVCSHALRLWLCSRVHVLATFQCTRTTNTADLEAPRVGLRDAQWALLGD